MTAMGTLVVREAGESSLPLLVEVFDADLRPALTCAVGEPRSLPPGRYAISVALPGRPELRQVVEVVPDEVAEVVLPLSAPTEPAAVELWNLRLLSAADSPVPSVTTERSGGLRVALDPERQRCLFVSPAAGAGPVAVIAPVHSDLLIDDRGRVLPADRDGRGVLTAAARLVQDSRLVAARFVLAGARRSLNEDGAALLGFLALALGEEDLAGVALALTDGGTSDALALRAAVDLRAGRRQEAARIMASALDSGPPALSMAVSATIGVARRTGARPPQLAPLLQLSRQASLGDVLFTVGGSGPELSDLVAAAWMVESPRMVSVLRDRGADDRLPHLRKGWDGPTFRASDVWGLSEVRPILASLIRRIALPVVPFRPSTAAAATSGEAGGGYPRTWQSPDGVLTCTLVKDSFEQLTLVVEIATAEPDGDVLHVDLGPLGDVRRYLLLFREDGGRCVADAVLDERDAELEVRLSDLTGPDRLTGADRDTVLRSVRAATPVGRNAWRRLARGPADGELRATIVEGLTRT